MKAARLAAPRTFEFLDIPTPDPAPGEALVRIEYLSVCGSDLRIYDRTFPDSEYPMAIGRPCHEVVGIVEKSGGSFSVGQRVVALTYAGALVEYAAVPEERLVAVPESFDPALWVLCQPAGTVVYAVQKMGSLLGQRVVILGQGPIGLVFTDLVARAGATQVIVTDPHDYRLEAARRVGATHTINPTRENVAAAVAEITGGRMADIAVEAAGRAETVHQTFETLHQQGLAVIFGIPHTEDTFPMNWLAMYEKIPRMIVVNSQRAGEVVDSVKTCVDLVAQERLDFSYLLTHRVPFSEISRGYELYSQKKENSLKLLITV